MTSFSIRTSLGGIEGREEEKKKTWLDTEGWKNISFSSICGVTNTVTYCPGVYNHRLCCRHSTCLMRQPVRNNETLKQIVLTSKRGKRKDAWYSNTEQWSVLVTSLLNSSYCIPSREFLRKVSWYLAQLKIKSSGLTLFILRFCH